MSALPDVDELAETCGVTEDCIHIGRGKPADVIRKTADDIEADLILIGTVGRSGIKGTVVGNTSVRIRVALEKIRIGPNSPNDLAHARVNAATTPRHACGNAISENERNRLAPRVLAMRSGRSLICSNVSRIVLIANAAATVNWARMTAGIS